MSDSDKAIQIARQINDQADRAVALLLMGLTPYARSPLLQSMMLGTIIEKLQIHLVEFERKAR